MGVGKAVWITGLFAVTALVLVACGGSDPVTTTSQTAAINQTGADISQPDPLRLSTEESDYLAEVLRAEESAGAVFEDFGTIFAQTYPVREALIAALLKAGVGTPFIDKLAILEALDPPDRFREDHQTWLDATRELFRIDTEAGDLVRFSILNGQLGGVDVSARIALSPVFCRHVGLSDQQLAICTPDDSALDGEFETTINDLIRGFMPAFSASQGNIGFRLSLTPEELNQILSETAASARDAFQGFAAALDTITPPGELSADHERLRAFFSRVVEIVAEVDRLGKANDVDAARRELLKLEPAFCDARASFEAQEFKDAVAILFLGGLRTCGGTSF